MQLVEVAMILVVLQPFKTLRSIFRVSLGLRTLPK